MQEAGDLTTQGMYSFEPAQKHPEIQAQATRKRQTFDKGYTQVVSKAPEVRISQNNDTFAGR